MDRQVSVEDIVGGLYKLGSAGFPRTDSEAAFQDFLKRIPSTTNLAGQAEQLNPQQQLQLQHHVQQLQQNHLTPSNEPPDATHHNIGGIPRVPSLDFLRQLMTANPAMSPQARRLQSPEIKMETHPRPNSAEQQSVVSSQQHHIPLIGAQTFPLITSIPAPVSLSTSLSSVPATLNPVPSSSMRLGQMPSLQLKGQSSDATAAMDRDALAKAELRRARRMLSNRESARRSRRRKQEHLSTLEGELQKEAQEKEETYQRMVNAERRVGELEDENKQLKRELDKLRKEKVLGNSKSPRTASQRISSPRKRQCSGLLRDDTANTSNDGHDEMSEVHMSGHSNDDNTHAQTAAVAAGM